VLGHQGQRRHPRVRRCIGGEQIGGLARAGAELEDAASLACQDAEDPGFEIADAAGDAEAGDELNLAVACGTERRRREARIELIDLDAADQPGTQDAALLARLAIAQDALARRRARRRG
jgi:hypothetical protein